MNVRWAVVFVVFPGLCGAAAGQQPEVEEIVRKVDRLYRSETSYAEVEMAIETPHWERTLRMKIWTKGQEKTFIYITAPRKDAGITTLRVGREMWNYFPKINKVMKVPPSMMMGSWMGSDFTNDDLVKESSMVEDYEASWGDAGREDVYGIVLAPHKDTPSVWGKIMATIRKEDLLPVSYAYFDEKGNRMRVLEFREIQTFDGRKIPSVMEMTPLNEEGRRTTIRYLEAEFDPPLDEDLFTLRNLRKRR